MDVGRRKGRKDARNAEALRGFQQRVSPADADTTLQTTCHGHRIRRAGAHPPANPNPPFGNLEWTQIASGSQAFWDYGPALHRGVGAFVMPDPAFVMPDPWTPI